MRHTKGASGLIQTPLLFAYNVDVLRLVKQR